MPEYHFRLRTPNQVEHAPERRELSDLREALIAAHGVARGLIHNHVRRKPCELHGSLDVEDEQRRPIARILLADVVRQIS